MLTTISIILVLISACMAVVGVHAERDGSEFSHFWIIALALMFVAYLIVLISSAPVV